MSGRVTASGYTATVEGMIHARYPDDPRARLIAATAAEATTAGRVTLQAYHAAWQAALRAERDAMAALTGAIAAEVAAGVYPSHIATELGMARKTVLRAIGAA